MCKGCKKQLISLSTLTLIKKSYSFIKNVSKIRLKFCENGLLKISAKKIRFKKTFKKCSQNSRTNFNDIFRKNEQKLTFCCLNEIFENF